MGEELSLFAEAINWKQYYAKFMVPYFGKRVLEVGAGIGATTEVLCRNGEHEEWMCLEPDGLLLSEIERKIKDGELPDFCSVVEGQLTDLKNGKKYDSILYIDVLEHIEHDHQELLNATSLLNDGGHLIVLSPSFKFLYSSFDRSIGHFRRYDKGMISEFPVPRLKQVRLIYLDSVGMLTSLANKYLLRQDYPTKKQILLWDRWIIPFAKLVDPMVFYSFGRSILGIWVKK